VNTVYLHGGIGKRFGRKWQVDARNSQEVIKALDANNEGFIGYIVKQELEGNRHFLLAKHPDKLKSEQDLIDNIIAENEINREIHVVPSVYGGFVYSWLVGFSFISEAAALAMTSALWGGVAQLAISALQKTPENKVNTRGDNVSTKSFLLGASRETASQGGSIPLGYGRALIGPNLIGQSMTTTRIASSYLESSSQLKFTHLICEGPIEGPVNEYGAKINAWNDSSGQLVPNPDVQKALYINENQLQKGEFFNYNLSETGDLPSINISRRESNILDDNAAIIHTINQELFGVSPHHSGSTHLSVDQAFPGDSNEEKPTVFSHKISNIDAREVIINFRGSVFVTRQSDGVNQADQVYFAIFILGDDGVRRNVLEHPDRYILRFDADTLKDINKKDLGVRKDSSGRIYLSGIATSAYQFEFYIGFREKFTKNTPTIQIVKLSKETDVSAASNIYTTWTTTSRKWYGAKKVHQHSKTDWNSIGGQGRSRSISVSSIEERIMGKFAYPNCVTSRIIIDSLNFASQPTFMWHLKLKKVLVPENYNPKTRRYNGPWNGLFKGQAQGRSIYSIDEKHKEWTDNPAWIFYDLVSNPTYGCGKYGVGEYDIDKWQIYKIAKYCDEMVETNYPIQTDSGLLKTFEYKSFGNVSYTEGQLGKNNSVAQFKITLDKSTYSKDEYGNLVAQEEVYQAGFDTYYEYTSAGNYSLTIPEGVTEIEILTIGGGGSGQVMNLKNFIVQVHSINNGNNGEPSTVSSGDWSVSSMGGSGGGIVDRNVTSNISESLKIVSRINGINQELKNSKGADRSGSSDLLISGASGSNPALNVHVFQNRNSSSNTPSFGAGSGSGAEVYTTHFFRYISTGSDLTGGGSSAASLVRAGVDVGDIINITVGSGGAGKSGVIVGSGRSFSRSGAGGSGMVAIRYILKGQSVGLSTREQFVRSFGDGDSFKGKSVAFFINKHNYGSAASNYRTQIKNKSVLKQNCLIERRQIISSDADEFTVTLAGEDFSKHEASFEVDVNGSRQYIMYGACAAEIDHPIVEPRFTANLYLKDSMESINLLNMFANMFRARLSYSSGKISIQQDSKNLPIQLFNNTNVSSEGFAYSGSQKDQRFSVAKVMFNNKENEFKEEYVYEEDAAAIQKIGIVETEMSALSVSSESEARRLAKWILMSAQYEQEVVKFTAGQEGAYTFPGAIIEIYDEMRSGDLRSGRVLDIVDDIEEGGETYFLIDKSVIKEPILGDIELTVSAGADHTTLEKVESRAQNESSITDQDYEIENLQSQQLLKFQARLIPDADESKSRVVDMVAKMQFELSIDEAVFKIFYHGFKDGDKIRFYSDGVLPSGLSPFEEYYVICVTNHSFKVSLYPPVYLSGTLTLYSRTIGSNLVANIINGTGTNFTTELNVGDHIVVEGFDFIVVEIESDTKLIINKSHPPGFTNALGYTGIIPLNMFNIGKDKLLNIGGEHFVIPIDPQKTQEKINQVMIGAIYSIRGNIGVIEDNKDTITSSDLSKIGVTGIFADDWLISSIFGQVKIVDANWMYARNLGWIYIKDIISRETQATNEYFWFYVGSFGWVGTTEVLKNTKWYIPSLKQNKDGATGFVDIKYDAYSGNISNVFVYYESQENVDVNIKLFNLGSSNKKLGRLCEVTKARDQEPYGYILNISDYDEDFGLYIPESFNQASNQEKYNAIKITGGYQVTPGESLQQQYALRLNIENQLEFDLSGNYNMFVSGVSGYNSEGINKVWNFIFINETTLEFTDSANVAAFVSNFNFDNAYLYLLKEFDSDLKKFIEAKYFKILNNKEIADSKYEITATEYSFDKFDAIDRKGVIRKPVIPIPPQEAMDIPEAPTNLVLVSSSE
jgi:predicted phage tail protein